MVSRSSTSHCGLHFLLLAASALLPAYCEFGEFGNIVRGLVRQLSAALFEPKELIPRAFADDALRLRKNLGQPVVPALQYGFISTLKT